MIVTCKLDCLKMREIVHVWPWNVNVVDYFVNKNNRIIENTKTTSSAIECQCGGLFYQKMTT